RTEVDFHRVSICSHTYMLAKVRIWNRVKSTGNLDVVIRMNLRLLDVDRNVEQRGRWRLHRALLDGLVHLTRNTLGASMNTRAGDFATPMLRTSLSLLQARERLAVEPALANVRDLILDTRFVFGRADARCVDEETARLHAVEK